MTDDRVPCPYCGSKEIESGAAFGTLPDGAYFVQTGCNECGALGPQFKFDARAAEQQRSEFALRKMADDEADKLWDMRAPK